MAPDGSWVAFCQPTEDTNGDGQLSVTINGRGERIGDRPEVHLAWGDAVEQIDELLTFDPSGRWLVIHADEGTFLVDGSTGQRVDLAPLDPDIRSDEMFEVAHRSFSFDAQGTRLLVLSRKSQFHYEAHLLDLPSSEDATPVDPSRAQRVPLLPGEVWRVRLAPDGALLMVDMILHEPGGKNYQWPAPFRKEPLRRCHGPWNRAGAWAQRGGQITTLVAPTAHPTPHVAPGFVLPAGTGWVSREGNGRLVLVKNGSHKQVASDRCGARVLHADPSRELYLISCEHYAPQPVQSDSSSKSKKKPPKFRFELFLVAPGVVVDLEADMAAMRLDLQPSTFPRLVPLRPGARSVLVDMDERRLHELQQDDRIIATHESRALVRRGRKLILYDANDEKELELADQLHPFPSIQSNGRYAFVTPYLVDLADGKVLFEHEGTPLAVTNTGKLLVPSVDATDSEWAQGPLEFVD